jgi:hypothetical protein
VNSLGLVVGRVVVAFIVSFPLIIIRSAVGCLSGPLLLHFKEYRAIDCLRTVITISFSCLQRR